MWPVIGFKPSSALGSSTKNILMIYQLCDGPTANEELLAFYETRRLITMNQTISHIHSFKIRFSIAVLLSKVRQV
jgi:hypothetical protein